MRVVICIVIVFFVSVSFVNSQKRLHKQEPQPLSLVETVNASISVEAAQRLISTSQSDLVILDVRLPDEYNLSTIDKAVNIYYNPENFSEKINSLDKSKQYLVYCRSGARSTQAIEVMQKEGFKRLFHMSGGILAWEAETK